MLSAWLCAAFAPGLAMAESGHTDAGNEDPGEASQRHFSMHQLSKKPPLPRLHMDYGQYRYIPAGDRIKEQPDMNRLLFWTTSGEPDAMPNGAAAPSCITTAPARPCAWTPIRPAEARHPARRRPDMTSS